MRIKLRVIGFMLTLLCAACLYTSFMCYIQMVDYHEQIVYQNKRIDEATSRWNNLNSEDLILIERIEDLKKQIKAQDDKIRIQDALIAESRVRNKKK